MATAPPMGSEDRGATRRVSWRVSPGRARVEWRARPPAANLIPAQGGSASASPGPAWPCSALRSRPRPLGAVRAPPIARPGRPLPEFPGPWR